MTLRIKNSGGFTLIEMAIVLVIISLILGMILLSGGATVGSTKTGKTITIISELSEAVSQFKSQYKYLPGDMLVNTEIAGVTAFCKVGGADVGDGDGQITANEATCVPEHLFRAGFIRADGADANGIQTLVTPYGSIRVISLANSVAGPSGLLGAGGRNVNSVIEVGNLPCSVAQEIDRKTDDDNITTGRTQAAKADGTSFGACNPGDIIPLLIVTM